MFERSTVNMLLILNKSTDVYDDCGCFWKAETAHEAGKARGAKYKVIERVVFTNADRTEVWLAENSITVGNDVKELRRKQALAKLTVEEIEVLGLTKQ